MATHRNFARGEPPPSHSYEWAGVAKPPSKPTTSGKSAPKPRIPVMIATMRETIVIEQKKRPWLWMIGAGAIGFLLGRKSKKGQSHGL